jgi:hypothetical protein
VNDNRWPVAPTRLQVGAVSWNDKLSSDSGNPAIEGRQCRALRTLHRVTDTGRVSAAPDPMQKFGDENSPPKS